MSERDQSYPESIQAARWYAVDEIGNDNFATSIYESGDKGLLVARCNQNGQYPWQANSIIRGMEENKKIGLPDLAQEATKSAPVLRAPPHAEREPESDPARAGADADQRPHEAPEWIWYGEVDGKPVVTFGRWPKHGAVWRYKWAEIQPTEHDHGSSVARADAGEAEKLADRLGEVAGRCSRESDRVLVIRAAAALRTATKADAAEEPEKVDITGWKLVPDQPTGAMWEAGRSADIHPGDSYSKVWSAMFDAAPCVEDCETVVAPPVAKADAAGEPVPNEYAEMLWKWFEDESRIGVKDMRPEYTEGLSADDFKTMLDEHERALIDAAPPAAKADEVRE